MAKLYFKYGVVGSAKTLNLLAVAHSYKLQSKSVLLIKPALDDRFGKETIKSRAGLQKEADIMVEEDTDLSSIDYDGIDAVLVDEVQFLSTSHIDQLRDLSLDHNIPVICYGLRNDFRSHFFEGSKRLMEVADCFEEIRTTCFYCQKKATVNLKFSNGKPTFRGPVVDLGAEEKYLPVCYSCYRQKLRDEGQIKTSQDLNKC
ncbi:MAG: thymidine kinase [Chlamydiota bacterium]